MRPVVFLLTASLVLISTLSSAQAKPHQPAPKRAPDTNWDALVEEFFNQNYFKFGPTAGTAAGFHQYDPLLEDYSRAAYEKEILSLKEFRSRFEDFDPQKLNEEQQGDRQVALGYIDSTLLNLETLRLWEKNPDQYSSNISSSVFVIMSRNFAPPEERLKSVIAREKLMPKVFVAARANLNNPPKIYTEIALMQVPGIISFFQKDVPEAFKGVHDSALLKEFHASNSAVIHSLENYEKWVKNDLLPRSKGDFRLGAENYSKKLLYDEMVDLPLDRLLEIGMANLRANQQWYKETAALYDSTRTPQQILEEIGKDHPAPDKLLQSFRDVLGGLKTYIEEKKIITIPSEVMPIVEETPPFARALTFASMDTPGPYERKAKEAYFNVTLPEPDWKPEEVEEHMAGFNYGTIISTAVHEAYPGHYIQFLWEPQAPSKIRKLLGANTDIEGWAHYCEQMMLDEGYGRDPNLPLEQDKKFLKLRLGQLQDALLRNARFIVGIKMHTGQMTFDQAVDFFVTEGYQSRTNGERETRRGTSDPTYLYYTLGKLQILKLREDYKKKMGDKFSLQEFHDQFIKQGFPPIRVIRKAMLGDDSPVL
ncbi:MAG TPA: DUF885 domain-containing protein [Terriglobales bacterium]|jgi:hypothetical protein|nr:DUF885 domain-containing protein [Terriglobales bacterium]